MPPAADDLAPASAALPEVPVENLTRWHASIADELREAFEAVLPVGKYTLGAQLAAFEAEFAAYCDSAHAIGISSGTAALHLGLRALGVGPGDEVITVPNTYVATVFAITYIGAIPVFVDVDPATANMDPTKVASAVTERTRAILPVHMYGACVDVDAIRILEDAAHAHGATYKGRKAGALGEIAEFSFYPSKVLGALGDGGALTTSDPELDARVRQLRYMGQRGTKHEHLVLGYQERLDELQAAFLRVKLRGLEAQLEGRRRVAASCPPMTRSDVTPTTCTRCSRPSARPSAPTSTSAGSTPSSSTRSWCPTRAPTRRTRGGPRTTWRSRAPSCRACSACRCSPS
jgi:dTDP-4-amino-4,6-dideoxygalactose transaminase